MDIILCPLRIKNKLKIVSNFHKVKFGFFSKILQAISQSDIAIGVREYGFRFETRLRMLAFNS